MINSRKKGFTLVELVIVIAVIAVLAAVLIPTFSSLVKKANLSADQQAVRQINTLLATEFVTDKPETLKEVVDMLDENGYNTDALIPLTKGMAFVWNKDTNTISLVPTEEVQNNETLEDGTTYINVEVNTASSIRENLTAGKDVTLTSDIDLGLAQIVVPEGKNVDIDLNGKTLTIGMRDSVSHPQAIVNNGTMTIKGNGKIVSRGINNNGELTIEPGVIVEAIDSNGGGAIWGFAGSKTVINGGTYKALNGDSQDGKDNDPVLIYVDNGAEVEVNGGTFEGNGFTYGILVKGGKLTINNGTFTHSRGCLSAESGTVIINGGTFTVTGTYTSPAHTIYAYDGNVTINNATLNNNGSGETTCVDSDGSGKITVK